MTLTNNHTTTELPMPTTIPFFWRMYQLKRFHEDRGYHFFKPFNIRFFRCRVQSIPPYKGRVFVTSEKAGWSGPRHYSVRYIDDDGRIKPVGDLGGFTSRQSAHSYAKAYASENFERVGNESVQLPKEIKMV